MSPLSRRAAGEAAYAVVGLVVSLVGVVPVLLGTMVGLALSVTVIGLPLVVLSGFAARGFGAVFRALAGGLLGEAIPAPARPPRAPTGVVTRIREAFLDATAWRARAFLVLHLPVAVLACGLAVLGYGYGLMGLTYAAWRPLLPVQIDPIGVPRRGLALGTTYLDTPSAVAAVGLCGIVLLLAAPWLVRGVLALELLLARTLLSPSTQVGAIVEAERRRAHAIDDSAATLRRIERDLHDGPQARLVATAISLGVALEQLDDVESSSPALTGTRSLIGHAHREIKETLAELRDIARGFHPAVLDNGLATALNSLAVRRTMPVDLTVELPVRPSPAIETLTYFCIAELLTNVAKHADARSATVRLAGRGHGLRLTVADDGRGGAHVGQGAGGLSGLVGRIDDVGGTLVVESPAGGPTTITIDLPVRA